MLVGVPSAVARFLPTPSARRATFAADQCVRLVVISTHALREEGDLHHRLLQVLVTISTHALREEGDIDLVAHVLAPGLFLPTPSARRATANVP